MRFTVRRMMIAVALASVVLGVTREVSRLGTLAREYRRKALVSAREERQWRRGLVARVASEAEARRLSAALRPRDRDLADLWELEALDWSEHVGEVRAILAHHSRMRHKYERAASRPWEPVAPDPPEPHERPYWGCVATPKEPLPPGERWYSEDAERAREMIPPR
jgi:hypothetical protein